MATGLELAEIVLGIVQDDSYDENDALYQFNQCAAFISGQYVLPSLDHQGTVTTSTETWSVSAPATFQRNLYEALDSAGRPIGILDSRKQMLAYCDGKITTTGGRIERLAVVGNSILYWPINTTAEELTLFYQRRPTAITLAGEVDLLPGAFSDNDQVFINFACWKLYEKIEQGLEGQKVDTNHHLATFTGLLGNLGLYLNKESGVSFAGSTKVVRMQRW